MTEPAPQSPAQAITQPETRGIELIGDAERQGRARDLFAVWAAPNVTILNFTVGATLIFLGLNVWQALIVTVAGSLPWLLTGILAIAGPSAGTSSSVITRALFGIVGNRLMMAILGGALGAVYLSLGWVASAFLGAELLRRYGVTDPLVVPVMVTLAVAIITVAVAVYGYNMIVRLYPFIAVALLVVFIAVAALTLPLADWNYAAAIPLTGVETIAAMSVGFTILASTPLSYTTSPDFSRYLPRDTKRSHIIIATTLGGALPTIVFTFVGALIATGLEAASVANGIDYALLEMLPTWLAPLLVGAVLVNTVAINAMTTYSASMSLQAIGLPLHRIPAAIIVGAAGTGLTLYLVLASDLLDAVNLTLQFTIIAAAPVMGVFLADVALRRGRYDGDDLFDERPGGRFWYTGGWSIPGMVATLAGAAASALCLTTDVWSGPVAQALNYIDLSAPAGLIVGAGLYIALTRLSGKEAAHPHATRAATSQLKR